jgi:hypothetical protein
MTRRPFAAALVLSGLVLAATAEERTFGLFSDGRTMTRTSFAIADLHELGIARGYRVEVRRTAGDAVSRYALGSALAFSLPMLAAESAESVGPGASQTLFVLAQIALLLAAAACAGLLVREWGASRRDAARGVLACALASPLLAYAGSDFSEPFQAAVVGAVFVLASRAARRGLRACFAAGVLAGLALLGKSIFVVLLPAVLGLAALEGLRGDRLRRAAAVVSGFVVGAVPWLVLELARFGRLFGGYAGERFSNPPLDGLWRLLVGPNKGLLVYFPLLLLVPWGARALARRSRTAAFAALGFCAALLVSTAAWWAWDGTGGWGPRLLLPMVPLLAALAALASARVKTPVFTALLTTGILVNALGLLTPDAFVTWLYALLPPRALTTEEAARYPPFAYERGPDGSARLSRIHDAARDPALSPLRVSAWLLETRLSAKKPLEALRSAPFGTLASPDAAWPSDVRGLFAAKLRWPHLGMCLTSARPRDEGAFAFLDGLENQAFRAQDVGDFDRAVDLSERFYRLAPGARSAAVLLESYRLAGKQRRVIEWTRALPAEHTASLEFGLSLALFARDVGDEDQARQLAGEVARQSGFAPLPARLSQIPTAEWPKRLRDLSAAARAD